MLRTTLALLVLILSSTVYGAEPFLNQAKTIPATAEWSREIVTTKGGKVSLAITGAFPLHVFVITSELMAKITKKEPLGNNVKDHLVADRTFEKGPVVLEVVLKPGSYQVMIQNLSGGEAEYRLTATEIVDAGKK
jgi:hypothetical protein